ncbi:MAG: N-glycosylase [Thermoproteota archaeon]|nr:MAG: N-glycosylase [Candidatus Korarchaeota archaeon]RLG51824.1 MAG: N-glycosylase [Candidatus Korarchaeota archaeon]
MRGLWSSLSSSRLDELLSKVRELKRSRVRELVDARMREFRRNGRKPSRELFKELCFCILTANFSAERSIRMQEEIEDGFLTLSEGELARELRRLGHRYPESRARYIVEARWIADKLKDIIESFGSQLELRDWLAKSIKGLGYKEASHFLRNIGFTDLAIIDFHILDLLASYGVVEKPRTLTRKRYLEIEEKLREIARSLGLTLAELDLYLWYLETGKVLK